MLQALTLQGEGTEVWEVLRATSLWTEVSCRLGVGTGTQEDALQQPVSCVRAPWCRRPRVKRGPTACRCKGLCGPGRACGPARGLTLCLPPAAPAAPRSRGGRECPPSVLTVRVTAALGASWGGCPGAPTPSRVSLPPSGCRLRFGVHRGWGWGVVF